MTSYDVIVIGCGGVGSATLMHLARRGLKVLGLDRFSPPHDHGSSHGRTRMIRQAYFEHPDYVPLVLRAYELWSELEAAGCERLYHETGLLQIGPPDGAVVPGVLESAQRHDLEVETLTAADVRRRFPGFAAPENSVAVLERRAGFLPVERCVQAHLNQAVARGAELHDNEIVQTWRADGDGAVVETDRDRYRAGRVVITAGPWASSLLSELGVPLVVRRKPQYWFAPRSDDYRIERGAPAFLFETRGEVACPAGVFYGFPVLGPEGLKCAEHTGGKVLTDPAQLGREVDEADLVRVRQFLQTHLPGVSSTLVDHASCMYTMSPDENFLVDRHPRHPQIVFAAGLSGHGFKFTSVLGEALADLATGGNSPSPIDFLSLKRFHVA